MDNRELLEYIFRGGGKQIVSTLPEGIHKQFDAEDVDAAWEYIVEHGKTANVYINPNGRSVRRHIVGGANRTLFSVDLPPRLCRTGT